MPYAEARQSERNWTLQTNENCERAQVLTQEHNIEPERLSQLRWDFCSRCRKDSCQMENFLDQM